MPQITHQGHDQIVSPQTLREVLDADGSDYSPPLPFDPNLEWDVARTKVHVCDCMYPVTVDRRAMFPDECPCCGEPLNGEENGQ
jgi:hypothetical protein